MKNHAGVGWGGVGGDSTQLRPGTCLLLGGTRLIDWWLVCFVAAVALVVEMADGWCAFLLELGCEGCLRMALVGTSKFQPRLVKRDGFKQMVEGVICLNRDTGHVGLVGEFSKSSDWGGYHTKGSSIIIDSVHYYRQMFPKPSEWGVITRKASR